MNVAKLLITGLTLGLALIRGYGLRGLLALATPRKSFSVLLCFRCHSSPVVNTSLYFSRTSENITKRLCVTFVSYFCRWRDFMMTTRQRQTVATLKDYMKYDECDWLRCTHLARNNLHDSVKSAFRRIQISRHLRLVYNSLQPSEKAEVVCRVREIKDDTIRSIYDRH